MAICSVVGALFY